jgi:hypothetical protein
MFSSIAASLIFSTIGFFLLKSAKKKLNFTWILIAACLMFYPYFTEGIWDWVIGVVLCTAVYFTRDSY